MTLTIEVSHREHSILDSELVIDDIRNIKMTFNSQVKYEFTSDQCQAFISGVQEVIDIHEDAILDDKDYADEQTLNKLKETLHKLKLLNAKSTSTTPPTH